MDLAGHDQRCAADLHCGTRRAGERYRHAARAAGLRSWGPSARGPPLSRRRYVARGVPGGWRVWDNKARRWWGEQYEVQPDDLVAELNGTVDYTRITALLKRYRTARR